MILILLPIFLYGQEDFYNQDGFSVSTEVDAANLAQVGNNVGGYNGIFKVNYRSERAQFGAFLEIFPNRYFRAVGVEGYGVFNSEGRVNYLAGFAMSLINRTEENLTVYNAPSVAIQGQVEYHLTRRFSTYARLEYRYRGDINFLYDDGDNWVTSGFIAIKYKFN